MRDLSVLNILVVENNKHMRSVIVELLRALGTKQILEAEDPLGGFSLIATEDIDLVLLDFFLGEHDGYDIIALLRGEKPCPNHNVPIIIMTAAPTHDRVLEAKSVGADAILGKPLAPQELYEIIDQVLSKREGSDGTDPAQTPEVAS